MTLPAITTFIGLGSNLGDRMETVRGAVASLGMIESTNLVRCSSIIETDPVGPPGQSAYLNAVAALETSLEPRALLEACLAIERAWGRVRPDAQRWGPRTLDLDLLVYGSQVIEEEGLLVPHPRLGQRLFVLEPLHELAPTLRIPNDGRTVTELLDEARRLAAIGS